MNAEILNELIHYLQNSPDAKKIEKQSNLSPDELIQVAQQMIPKMTNQVQNSSQTLSDLFAIIAQNKDNPKSLLNHKSGFDILFDCI